MAKTVCVVGAGPAGIIAAKTLLYEFPKGAFDVTVFEQTHNIGGLWPTSTDDITRINPELRTNLSRHTVAFSDLAWPEESATFPKAWHVGQYLKRYLETYPIPNIRTRSKVIKAIRSANAAKKWDIEVQHLPQDHGFPGATVDSEVPQPESSRYEFDHLIVASGFFGQPTIPDDLSGLEALKQSGIPIIHSLNFQRLPELLASSESKNKKSKIVVIGGQMSGAETAAAVALQISSAAHSPGEQALKNASDYSVHQIIRRPFWALPAYMPTIPMINDPDDPSVTTQIYNPATPFLPLDLVMYDLSRRPAGEIQNQSGMITESAAEAINSYLEKAVGGDQSSIGGSDLAVKGTTRSLAPRVAIADRYGEFVRSGLIKVHTGEVSSYSTPLEGDTALVKNEVILSDSSSIQDVAAVIFATGFDACGSLSYLPPDVLKTLQYDQSCTSLPIVLDFNSTVNRDIADLGFVGFYRGPFWGVMEMQARFLGKLWTGDDHIEKELLTIGTSPVVQLRDLYYNQRHRLAQFPMGDYIYLMESMADLVQIGHPNGSPFRPRNVPAIPSLYVFSSSSEKSKAESSLSREIAFKSIVASSESGKFVSKAAFSGLQGNWNLRRTLKSVLPTHPSGTFHGKASFHPRYPTGKDGEYDGEYLYIEEGDFVTETGLTMRANRRYVYRYSDATDLISAWFVKPDALKTVDYLFHEVEILPPKGQSGWRAKSYHLCVKDHYNVLYEFRFKGAALDSFNLGYGVKGPQKDYRIESTYVRE